MQAKFNSGKESSTKKLLDQFYQNPQSTSTYPIKTGEMVPLEMDKFRDELKTFQEKSENYKGPCFTKELRALLAMADRISADMDKIDCTNRDKIRQERNQISEEIQAIYKNIKSKVHPEHCDRCDENSYQTIMEIRAPRSLNLDAIFEEFEKQATPLFQKLVGNNLTIPEDKFKTTFSECKRKLTTIIKKHKIDTSREEIKDLLNQRVQSIRSNYQNQIDEINSQVEQLLKNTKEKLKLDLEKSITNWVNEFTNLNNHLKKSWSTLFEAMLSKYHQDFYDLRRHSDLRQQFTRRLHEVMADWKTKLLAVESALKFYEDQMEAKFSKYRCFPNNHSDYHHQNILSKAVTKLFSGGITQDSQYNTVFAVGIQKYASQFQKRNFEINQLEIEAASQIADHPPMYFYREIMTKLTTGSIFKPEDLQKRHVAAVKEILLLLNNAFDFKGAPESTDVADNLEKKLFKEFQAFVNKNMMNITKVTSEARIAVNKHRTLYNEKMENAMSGACKSKEELEKTHKSFIEEVVKSLEFDIKKLEFSISPEEHVADLRQRIGKDWIELQIANEKKAKEAVRELQEQEEKTRRKKACQLEQKIFENKGPPSTSRAATTSVNQRMTTGTSTAASTPLMDLPNLPPMAIAFTPTYVTTGYKSDDTEFKLIHNKWGEQETPIKLGILKNAEIVVGREAEEHFKDDKFGMEFYTSKEIMSFTGESHYFVVNKSPGRARTLRSEGLCGLFLAEIKSDTEKQLNGRWSDVVITVPLGYTNVQRQAMKDAAKIAGFCKVFLINETSAAALCFANEPERVENQSGKCIMVGISSDEYFDAAVYEYGNGKVQMVSSCGNLHASSLTESFNSISRSNQALLTVGLNEPIDTDVQHKKDFIKANFSKYELDIQENLFFSYCSTNDGNHRVETTIRKHGRKLERDNIYILQGAAYFAQFLIKGDNSRVKDLASYVFFRSSTTNSVHKSNIFEAYQGLVVTKMFCKQFLGAMSQNSGFRVAIEEASLVHNVRVGNLEIKPPEVYPMDQKLEVYAKFSVINEGIFQVEEVYCQNTSGDSRKKINLQFEWKSCNLNDDEIYDLTQLVALLQKDGAKCK